MEDIIFSFNSCINPKHSDLTISQIEISGPIKWAYAYGHRNAEKEKVEYNKKLNEAVSKYQPIIKALNESHFGDLSKQKLEDICNRNGILFDDFNATFLSLGEIFPAASRKLHYKHGHLFYESEIHCHAEVHYNNDDIQIVFPIGYFGDDYPSDVKTDSGLDYKLLWSFHDVSDFSVEAYRKIFE
ncbi:MAG: hypothetical protein HQK71_02415, partial [Desulfamplus sp.]|nr:hypothetical protein [Desulfamplus sp.]